MEEKQKSVKGFIIAIIILIIIVFGLIIYILYDKEIIFNSSNKKEIVEKNTKKEEEKTKKISTEEKEILLEKIKKINSFSKYYPLTNANQIPNQEVLLKLAFEIGFGKSFSEEAMTEKIKDYFGDGYAIKNEDIICSIDKEPFYVYNSNTNMYRYAVDSIHGHGGAGGISEIVVNYVDGKVIKDKIIIDTKLLYSTYCSDTCGPNYAYYASYQDALDNKPILGQEDNYENEIELTDQLYKTIEDKLPTTTYTFTKKDNNTYSLESVIIK